LTKDYYYTKDGDVKFKDARKGRIANIIIKSFIWGSAIVIFIIGLVIGWLLKNAG